MYKIEKFNYYNLPKEIEKEYLSNNGCGKEYASYLVLYKDNKILYVESDAMESEDATFTRDLSFIKDWIEEIIDDKND